MNVDPDGAGGVALLRFAAGLCASADLTELEHRLVSGLGRIIHAPMFTLYLFDPGTGRPSWVLPVNISEAMLARYERLPEGRQTDPLLARVVASGGGVYNLALMSAQEWLDSPMYMRVLSMHDMRHVVQVPVLSGRTMVGTLNLGSAEPERGYTAGEVRLAEAVGRVVGAAIEAIRVREDLGRELQRARAALELTGCAVVVSDPRSLQVLLNEAARRLLGQVEGGEARIYGLIAPPADAPAGFSRSVVVRLVGGDRARLHGYSSRLPRRGGGLVTVLELDAEHPGGRLGPLVALTPRERQVAALVVDGLADREIAERLYLSRHTVSQYAKRIYRKLGVDSRVTLTRLLLGHHELERAPRPPSPQ